MEQERRDKLVELAQTLWVFQGLVKSGDDHTMALAWLDGSIGQQARYAFKGITRLEQMNE